MPERPIKFALAGVGNIGRRFLQLILDKETVLYFHYGLKLELVGVADSSGAALHAEGLDVARILELKSQGTGVAKLPEVGKPDLSVGDMVRESGAELFLDASPTNLVDGQPGLGAMEAALELGMNVVSANKGPLVLAYQRLQHLARQYGVAIRHSAAVSAACPTVNIGERDLSACEISRVEGVFNMTTNYILSQMAEEDLSFGQALAQAQAQGIAEADPTLDVDGWDTANKLVILANSILAVPTTLQDVQVTGIRQVDREMLAAATAADAAVKLVATATQVGSGYRLEVAPTQLSLAHPLGRLAADELGVVYETDVQGTISAIAGRQGTLSTAGAVLRDVIDLYRA